MGVPHVFIGKLQRISPRPLQAAAVVPARSDRRISPAYRFGIRCAGGRIPPNLWRKGRKSSWKKLGHCAGNAGNIRKDWFGKIFLYHEWSFLFEGKLSFIQNFGQAPDSSIFKPTKPPAMSSPSFKYHKMGLLMFFFARSGNPTRLQHEPVAVQRILHEFFPVPPNAKATKQFFVAQRRVLKMFRYHEGQVLDIHQQSEVVKCSQVRILHLTAI